MAIGKTAGAWMVGFLAVVGSAGCLVNLPPETTHSDGAVPDAETDASAWTVAFEDDFDRAQLGTADWNVIVGNWRIVSGMLVVDTGGGQPRDSVILINRQFMGDVRLEYDAIAGDDACDLSGILGANPTNWQNGYLLAFGANDNTESRLERDGAIITETVTADATILPDHLYHVVCEVEGNHVRLSVDDELVFDYVDANPLGYPGVGLYVWTAGMFDNLQVSVKE